MHDPAISHYDSNSLHGLRLAHSTRWRCGCRAGLGRVATLAQALLKTYHYFMTMAFVMQLCLTAFTQLPSLGARSSDFRHHSPSTGQDLDVFARQVTLDEDQMVPLSKKYELDGYLYYVNAITWEKQWKSQPSLATCSHDPWSLRLLCAGT